MARVAKRLLYGSAPRAACAAAALWASPASAQLFSADAVELSGDVRIVAATGEKSWLKGGFGKLRGSGHGDDIRVRPELGNVDLVWKPQLTWSLSATIVGSVQGGAHAQAGLSQAFLTFRPMRGDRLAFSARAGLMWPAISLEHEGADWHVRDSITPSAINSWIGEEVKPVAIEGTVVTAIGASKLRATAALMAANDTAGTLLTFRGWALHDRTTLAFNRQPLPPLGDLADYQAPYTHPTIDVRHGFAHRIGYYAKLAWEPPIPIRIELFRYDNRANPREVNAAPEWGWDTQFDNLGLVAELGGGGELKAQAMQGRTRMGYAMDGRRWLDNRFRSAFVMVTRPVGKIGVAARAEAFDTRHRGSLWDDEYDEHGWSAILAAKREWGPMTGLVQLLHVWSDTPAREYADEPARQKQTQLQTELRMRW